MKHALVWLTLVCLSTGAFAESEAPDLWYRSVRYHVDYNLNTDGSNTRTYDFATLALKDKAVEQIKKISVSYSTGVEKIEVLDAYTLKPDGKRIEVRKDNYQFNVNSGRNKDNPAFSDRTTLTVIFPEVTLGDAVSMRYRITQAEAIFPGHFSVAEEFSRAMAYDDVAIAISAPDSMKAQFQGRNMNEKRSHKNGRSLIEWTFENKNPVKNQRRDFSVYDFEQEPGYVYSTFKTYAEIAEAYGARARPRAAVTEKIQKLVDDITKDKKDPREQARAIYDWVATNVSYAGNCIGVGVVVPRDLGFVLDNRMGDCKDHATLLQAMLAAKGIASAQALINAGSVYRLPKIPVVSIVNHVINYIPAFDLFVDSTSDSTPFGMLPITDQDKPVLLVDGFKDGTRTPVPPLDANQENIKTVAKIQSDGTILAEIDITQKGFYAVMTRDGMRSFPKDQEADLVKNFFQGQGMIASGAMRKDDPVPLQDTYHYGFNLEIKKYFNRPGAGAFYVAPLFGTTTSVAHFIYGAADADDSVETACSSGSAQEDYDYELPPDMTLLSVPDSTSISNDFVSYEATYKQEGNHLRVMRRIVDRTKGSVCSPQITAAYKAFAEKVAPNLKAQVIYK